MSDQVELDEWLSRLPSPVCSAISNYDRYINSYGVWRLVLLRGADANCLTKTSILLERGTKYYPIRWVTEDSDACFLWHLVVSGASPQDIHSVVIQ